jgi:methylated-DNA-[protein]-cysteine S-methyltransferase
MQRRTTLDTPVGELTLVANTYGLQGVLWPDEPMGVTIVLDRDGGPHDPDHVLQSAVTQLAEYFAGSRTEFELPLDPAGTPFQQSAWMVLRTIPYGATISYGDQARALGDANKARAVGAANGKNPISIVVPCHRVVGANGTLTGFGGGLSAKDWLLRHEQGKPQLALARQGSRAAAGASRLLAATGRV